MARRRLPIGVQTFRKLWEDNCYYVDKTAYIERLLAEGTHYFLSRPRRFGKSLFLDTLKELFEGSEELFEGLHIHGGRDWSVRHPVVRLDFSGGDYVDPEGLRRNVMAQLGRIERREQVVTDTTGPERLGFLLEALHRKAGQRVAVLVDEYDKPILDAMGVPEIADANRRFLRSLYSNVKFAEAHVHFTFLTGVSKFTKVSVFSDLNNLTDITLDRRYSAICGYTEGDLDTVFAPELAGLDREQVREWYNGYRWRGTEQVYNPYDVLLLFDSREFKAHWFETGTPAFLMETLFERRVSSVSLDEMVGTEDLLSAFDVGNIGTEALLFQTGYLTITAEEELGGKALYRLGYPNREVRQSLNEQLLRHLVHDTAQQTANSIRLARLLQAHDCAGGPARGRTGSVAGARVRGQIPSPGRADPPDRRGVQPRDTQRDGVRGGRWLRRQHEDQANPSRSRSSGRTTSRWASCAGTRRLQRHAASATWERRPQATHSRTDRFAACHVAARRVASPATARDATRRSNENGSPLRCDRLKISAAAAERAVA